MSWNNLFAVAILALLPVVAECAGGAEPQQHPYKRAKVGEWTEYRTVSEAMGNKTEMKARTAVAAKDESSITLKIASEVAGQKLPEQTTVVKFEQLQTATQNHQTEELEKGSETLSAGGKSYACKWTKTRVTVETNGVKSVTVAKVWLCDEVPLGGLVRSESTTVSTVNGNEMKSVATMELTGVGS